jgi:cyclic dehypoxanthinyl futalosine synthase
MAITRRQALDFFRSDDLIGLGMEADAMRRRLHPEGVVTYSLDRSIDCGELNGESTNSVDTICVKIESAIAMGSNAIRLYARDASGVSFGEVERLLQKMKQRFPDITLQGFSAQELAIIAGSNNFSVYEALRRLRDAGLDSILGGAASAQEGWLAVHRAAHQLGMLTTATMIFGAGEPLEERIDLLEKLRALQEETGGFAAFIPVSFEPRTVAERDEEATAVEYLKVLAASRLYLDNVENMQSSWAAQGLKVLQMGLRFGANDAGSATPEENGAKSTTEETLRHIIRDAGFRPVQRDALYRAMFVN